MLLQGGILRCFFHTIPGSSTSLTGGERVRDWPRQEQSPGFLAQLAGETQVVLFSKDEWTREWVEEKVAAGAAHSLHILAQ